MSMLRNSSGLNSTIKESKVGCFEEYTLKGDVFYQDIEILFENGKPKLQTHCGVVMGFFMLSILISYGYMKTQIMLDY